MGKENKNTPLSPWKKALIGGAALGLSSLASAENREANQDTYGYDVPQSPEEEAAKIAEEIEYFESRVGESVAPQITEDIKLFDAGVDHWDAYQPDAMQWLESRPNRIREIVDDPQKQADMIDYFNRLKAYTEVINPLVRDGYHLNEKETPESEPSSYEHEKNLDNLIALAQDSIVRADSVDALLVALGDYHNAIKIFYDRDIHWSSTFEGDVGRYQGARDDKIKHFESTIHSLINPELVKNPALRYLEGIAAQPDAEEIYQQLASNLDIEGSDILKGLAKQTGSQEDMEKQLLSAAPRAKRLLMKGLGYKLKTKKDFGELSPNFFPEDSVRYVEEGDDKWPEGIGATAQRLFENNDKPDYIERSRFVDDNGFEALLFDEIIKRHLIDREEILAYIKKEEEAEAQEAAMRDQAIKEAHQEVEDAIESAEQNKP